MKTRSILIAVFLLVFCLYTGVQADIITLGSDADTWMVNGDPNAHGDPNFMWIYGADGDQTGYLRFDLSGIDASSIGNATLNLRTVSSTP